VRRLEFGLGLQSDKALDDYARLGRRAEELGFDVVTVYADLLFQPPLPALLEIAAATERVRLGPSCLNPFTLHPVEIAGQTAVLDAASGGRAFLGLARGAWLDRLGLETRRPVAAVREAVEVVRRLLGGDRSGFAGERFSLAAGAALRYDVLRPRVPLLIGTWSPRLAAFAGEEADEVKVGGSANPALVPVLRERIAVGARAAGRDVDEIALVFGAVTVCDRDRERARDLARREVAMYQEVVGELDPTVGSEPGDELDRIVFAGSPDDIGEHVERLRAAGVRRVDFGTPHGAPPEQGLELLGSVVRSFAG
jgi:5,10-methylenetetrahydromethanopterin reductase